MNVFLAQGGSSVNWFEFLFSPDRWKWLFSGSFFKFLLEGIAVNLEMAVIAMILSLILGLFLALGRISKNPLVSKPSGIWVDVWRNLPLIFILLYLSLALPNDVKRAWEEASPDFLPEAFQSGQIVAAIVGLTLYNSAVIAEIMRAGIQSLERGQGEAAAALGLPYWKSMRLIILPQGLRRMVPATVSQLITLNKDTTLAFIIGFQDVGRHGRILASCQPFTCGETVPFLQVFLVIGAMFILVNFSLSRLSRRLEIRQRERTGVIVERATGLEDQVAAEADVA
ncbi:MAG TPA: amino acid ABC transporter permease [Actinomycetota bacterium]|nr:amino acid ABC transporter permease [Actinomycetota bacterium]